MWTVRSIRGTVGHLADQLARLRIQWAPGIVDQAQRNAEIHRANILVGQQYERWRRAERDASGAIRYPFGGPALAQIAGSLGEARKEVDKLHALAASAEAMLAEAYLAWGLDPPDRAFSVHCDFDHPVGPDTVPIRIQPGSHRDHGQHADPQQRRPREPRGQRIGLPDETVG